MCVDKKIKYWFLLALSKAPRRGYGRGLLFQERPDFLDVNFEEFEKQLESLQSEGLIDNNPRDFFNFYLTDKGKKEVRNFYKPKNIKEFYDLLRYFPEFEIKDRIENIEVFLFNVVIMLITLYFMNKVTGFAALINFAIFFTSLMVAASHFGIISYLVMEKFTSSSKNKLFEWLTTHKYYLSYYLLIFFTVIAIPISLIYFDLTYKQLGYSLILELLVIGWTNGEHIQNWIQKLNFKK